MKKCLLFLLAIAGIWVKASANPNDTTTVIAQDTAILSWVNNYDTVAHFPDGTTTYRKVYMDFILGKYACPGYNPSNPGEIANGGTGWCSDWDYDIEVYACTATDTFELGRLITPYANTNYPRTPLSWSHPYTFDVTDFAPYLKNDVVIRVKYNGYSGGFTGVVKFRMIEGTPARNVLKVKTLFSKSSSYGYTNDTAGHHPIDSSFTAVSDNVPTGTINTLLRTFVTGHGGDANENCSEFCSKWYQFVLNNTSLAQTQIWRDNCASSFLYPQSGTWIHERANWCPGDLVHTQLQDITSNVTAGNSYTTAIHFQPYVWTDVASANHNVSQALYKLSTAAVYYGAYNHTVDAGIDEIISPTDAEAQYRNNPICGSPQINVTNYGSSNITSITFSYGINGVYNNTYTYNTSLASAASATVSLPAFSDLTNLNSTTVNQFNVKITSVNNAADGDTFNNTLTSAFTPAPTWNVGKLAINFKNGSVNSYHTSSQWTITDVASGNVVLSKTYNSDGNLHIDSLALPSGCYKLNVSTFFPAADNGQYGLNMTNWFNSANYTLTNGYIRIYNLNDGTKLALPKTDLGNTALEGNFGSGFEQYFNVVYNNTGVNDINNNLSLEVFPNPANDNLNISVFANQLGKANIQLVNMVGQVVYQNQTAEKSITIKTGGLSSGIYSLIYEVNGKKLVNKVVISH